jgi:hypothetical protein
LGVLVYGLVIGAITALMFMYSAREVSTPDGRMYTFVAPRKLVVVEVEDLVSVVPLLPVFDWARLYPMRVKTRTGTFLLTRGIGNFSELKTELLEVNPDLVWY